MCHHRGYRYRSHQFCRSISNECLNFRVYEKQEAQSVVQYYEGASEIDARWQSWFKQIICHSSRVW